MKKLTEEEEKQDKLDLLVKEMKDKGFKVLSPEEHRKLVEGKTVVSHKKQ